MIAWIGGRETGLDDEGQGDPVVFLHGFPLRRSIWNAQVAALSDRARCIAPDLRGFGESAALPPYTMDQYADDVAELLDHLQVERAVVCGLSMGGYVAFALWRRHAHRVRGLVLMGTRAGADVAAGAQRRRQLLDIAAERGSGGIADQMMPGMLGKTTRERNPSLGDSVYAMLEAAPVAGSTGALQAMLHRPDSTDTLGTINVPTLIVVGDEDVLTPVAESEAMHAGIRGSHLEVISGAGHLANIERPAAVNHVLGEFLASLHLT
ncbi:MAG: alpha/beta fold hydrolase [Gemmatimonadetes bacterium]|nr:alpha/beta fold hydrolase [Gemmatimonadota bacterium]